MMVNDVTTSVAVMWSHVRPGLWSDRLKDRPDERLNGRVQQISIPFLAVWYE